MSSAKKDAASTGESERQDFIRTIVKEDIRKASTAAGW